MCGIFAYIGDRQAVALLIAALKRLEYRGYDSAGAGIHAGINEPLKVRKRVGKVSNLEAACAADGKLEGTCGIAHTRWATHGKPSDVNSHPHTTNNMGIAVVHNGVIENYRSLKEDLTNKGYKFVSETDTELLAHLVEDWKKQMPDASWSQVVAMALRWVQGAYGVVFMFQDDPNLLVGARKGSPLILGVGTNEYMLASDASAIIEHTNDVVYLREMEIVEISRLEYRIQDLNKVIENLERRALDGIASPRTPLGIDNPIVRLELSLEQIEKGGYEHFMLKEIMDQPTALRNAMRGRLYHPDETQSWQIKLGGLDKKLGKLEKDPSALERLADAKRIIIAACGTSWHSALIAKYAFESLAKVSVEVEYASEFRYRRPLLCPQDVLIAISQSGETADTLEAIKIAKQNKVMCLGIVNVVGSSIARETDAGLYLHAGPEIGVASTKAFTGQVMALLLVVLKVAHKGGKLSQTEFDSYCDALDAIPDVIEGWLGSLTDHVKIISKYFRLANNVLFAGCGIHFPVALEGALKLKEISYIHAEGFPAAEIKHGPLTLVQSFMPVLCVAMQSDPAYRQIVANIEELRSKDAAVIVITNEGNTDFEHTASFIIYCPSTKLQFEPLIAAIPLQLFSYYIADMRGCSIDQPRNLAKSVTVE